MIAREKFDLIGIAVKTTNENSQAAADIGQLWAKFFSEDMYNQIPNKASADIYSIYTDYESDYTGTYTTIIGVPVTNLMIVPQGMIARSFDAETFQQVLAKGTMPDAVAKAWVDIWSRDAELPRKYTYDLEVYGAKSQQGEESEVDIFLAVRA